MRWSMSAYPWPELFAAEDDDGTEAMLMLDMEWPDAPGERGALVD